jgi:hypothetical protein
VLQTNEELKGAFRVEYNVAGPTQQVILSGSDDSAMLDAVYTFFEKAGIRFEISGPVLMKKWTSVS